MHLIFPPDGARLESAGQPLTIKLGGGVAPFSVLADGRPVATGIRRREFEISGLEAGFSTLAVVDARGRADRISLRLD